MVFLVLLVPVAVAAALLALGDSGADPVTGTVKRTSDVCTFTLVDGVVQEEPQALADAAGVTLDVFALATVIQSEGASLPEAGRHAIGWAVRNAAGDMTGVFHKLTSAPARAAGKFGSQNLGRYAATSRPPMRVNVDLAKRIAAEGYDDDPTGGADQFDSPDAQDALVKAGTKGYKKSSAEVAADRITAGKEEVLIDGVPRGKLRLWRVA